MHVAMCLPSVAAVKLQTFALDPHVYLSHSSCQQQMSTQAAHICHPAFSLTPYVFMFLQLRYDLLDTNITICAPEVLMLFSDNFDYQNLRKDFVTGVLSEEELGNKLYVYELQVGSVILLLLVLLLPLLLVVGGGISCRCGPPKMIFAVMGHRVRAAHMFLPRFCP